METSYLSLSSGSRLSNYLGLAMDEGYKYSYPGVQERNYGYIEIPLKDLHNTTTGDMSDKVLRNQHILVIPACSVEVRGNYRFEVHPNPELWRYATVQGMFYLEPREGKKIPAFYMTMRKDMDKADVAYAIRIYMRS